MADTAYNFTSTSVSVLFMMELLSTSSGIRHAILVANALMCVRFVISAQRFFYFYASRLFADAHHSRC